MIIRISFYCLLVVAFFSASAQNYVQTIRGVVIDAHTGIPLPGATVILNETKGIATDANGQFRFDDVVVGRHNLTISFVGYKPYSNSSFNITTGKEFYLEIKLEESTTELEAVEVKYKVNKMAPLNEMATASSRMFTIEETERYAGSVGDPARMASNFPGVNSLNDQSNTIVIRGNSPFGMLWIMEGIDIPNPSHFGAMGGTGGAISMLNNNTLNNSDFFTGAFPAQYSNALSGVFDLTMRQGNTSKFEFIGQVAFNGFEVGVEGPISSKNNTSFLANYRYSTMALMDKVIGVENLALQAVPYYQDLNIKATVYRGKLGRVSMFVSGGLNHIGMNDEKLEPEKWAHSVVGQNHRLDGSSGVAGVSHIINPGSRTKIETSFAFTGTTYKFWADTLTRLNPTPAPQHRHSDHELTLALSSRLTYKASAKNIFSTGIYVQPMQFQFVDSMYQKSLGSFLVLNNFIGNYTLSRFFVQWKHNFTDNTSLVLGNNVMHFTENNNISVEPRLGLRHGFSGNQSVSLAGGLHGNLAPRLFYVYATPDENGVLQRSNQNLGFTKSLHLIAGYDLMLSGETRLKFETYYQYHFNVPVSKDIPAWSILNYGSDWVDFVKPMGNLVNEGTGKNYGIELTLEKFLSRGYYYLITGSLYEAKYTGFDGVERNSVFNGNFIINALAGKEFTLKDRNVLSFDAKIVWAGSKRILPFTSYQVSEYYHVKVDDWGNAYKERLPDFFRVNLRVGYKINLFNATHELAVDFYNLTNRKNIFLEIFDNVTGETRTMYQFSFMPVALYRVQF